MREHFLCVVEGFGADVGVSGICGRRGLAVEVGLCWGVGDEGRGEGGGMRGGEASGR